LFLLFLGIFLTIFTRFYLKFAPIELFLLGIFLTINGISIIKNYKYSILFQFFFLVEILCFFSLKNNSQGFILKSPFEINLMYGFLFVNLLLFFTLLFFSWKERKEFVFKRDVVPKSKPLLLQVIIFFLISLLFVLNGLDIVLFEWSPERSRVYIDTCIFRGITIEEIGYRYVFSYFCIPI